jgi:hypothetical protein
VFVAEQVFPVRRVLGVGRSAALAQCRLDLGPHGAAVVEVWRQAELRRPVPVGCRYALVEDKPGKIVFDVFADAGVQARFELLSPTPLQACYVGDKPVDPAGAIVVPPQGEREHLSIRRLPDTPAGKDGVLMHTYRLDVPDAHQATVRILAEDAKLHALKISVNMGGFFGGLPFKVCQGNGWTAYDLELNSRDMNVVRWGFPPDDAPTVAKMWLIRRRELRRTRVKVVFAPVPTGQAWPELPTPFAGAVWDAVCVSDVAPEPAPELQPWTDEYAENADRGA